jgi:hypothetical protein
MKARYGLLREALLQPEYAVSLPISDWDLLVRQARNADLLARLCVLLDEQGLLGSVPREVVTHLESARTLATAHTRNVRWETDRIYNALAPTGTSIILLKGAAYVMAKLPPARGRIFHDVDIMVPKRKLEAVERALRWHGWFTTQLDEYDQRYYRQWTHELPPLRHIKRQTVLDVHHTIVPETARLKPDVNRLLAAAQPLNGDANLCIFAPADMVLHSATHLFNEGELENGLRDLVDLDDLLRHFGREQPFWPELVERAQELDLIRPLYYALRYAQRILGTPVPEEILEKACVGRPRRFTLPLMDAAFTRALAPDHPSCDTALTKPARFFLYVRSHYLRMPLHLLIPHLIRKAFKRRFDPSGQH